MPATTPMPFWTQSSTGRSKTITAEKIVNWYLAKNPPQSVFPYSLMPTPGLSLLAAVGDGPCRGMHKMGNLLWVVSGSKIYSVDSNYDETERGDIPGSGDCYMTDNGSHVLVVPSSGTDLSFAVNESEIIQVPETGLQGAAYQDGYAIAGKRGTEQLNISNVDDMTTWDALDFTSADALADFLIAVASVHRLIWCFGERTIEKLYNSGNATFPFERVQGGFVEIGCGAPLSVAVADDKVFWVGNDLMVYLSGGGPPIAISTDAVGIAIAADASPQNAVGWVYSQDHHTFYVLELASATLVFDLNTQLWHNRKSSGINRWRAHHHEYIWQKNVVGDYSNGNIYELSLTTYTDNGTTIRREADSAPLHASGNLMMMHELLVGMQPGVGLDGDQQGDDPELMVSWSDNDGNTYSNELTIGIGKIGEYNREVRLAALGSFRRRTVRIAISDPVNAVVAYAYHRSEALGS